MKHSFRDKAIGSQKTKGRWFEVKIHGICVVVVAASLLLADPLTTLVFGGIVCFFIYSYLGLREARKAALKLSPLSFYFFWYTVGLGISPLYLGLITEPGDMVRFASDSSRVSLDDLATGYVIFLVGSFALHLGMQMFRPQVGSEIESPSNHSLLRWLGLIWAGGLVFQMSPASFGFLGGTVKILSVAVVGSVCGLAVTPRKRLGLSGLAFVTLLVIGTASLFLGNLALGSKAFIMYSFLPITWLFILKRRLRTWAPALALCLAAFYLAVVAPVVSTSRHKPMEAGEDPRAHMIQSFYTWLGEDPAGVNESFFADQLDEFVSRQFDAVPVGFFVREVKSSGFLLGETMQYASYAFIPRLIWPDKPSVTRGGWFATYLGLYPTEAEATTSIGMTAIGELYWNFGTWGVLFGMLAIGCLLGGLWRMAGADPRGKPIHMLLYVSIMIAMPDMPEAVTVFVSVALSFLTFKAVFFGMDLMSRRARRSAAIVHQSPPTVLGEVNSHTGIAQTQQAIKP